MGLFTRRASGPLAGATVVRIDNAQEPALASRPRAPLPDAGQGELEPQIQAVGAQMLELARGHKYGPLSAKFYSDKMMEWSMKDHAFKVQMFRFVDAFPSLRTPAMVFDHLQDYMAQPGVRVPGFVDLALKAGTLVKGQAAKTIAGQIEGMAGKFIAGQDAAGALPGLARMWKEGIAFSVDLLGEACVSDAEADEYQKKYIDLVSNLPAAVGAWERFDRLERDHLGGIPRTNVSVKISSLSARCNPIDPEGGIRDVMRRLVPILELARDRGVFINFDMEQFTLKDLTIELFKRCCEAVDVHAGLAMQAYLRSGERDAADLASWARRTGRIVTVRLVKGAYWDYETINAEAQGWPSPVWSVKWESDACFERMAKILLDACPVMRGGADAGSQGVSRSASARDLGPTRMAPGAGGIKLALGTHNVRSIAACLSMLRSKGLPDSALELQMLHGMADQLKHAAGEMGLRVREYVPVGQMIPGMAYLVRRLLENTSNESWLKAGFMDNADVRTLLAPPGSLTTHPSPKRDLAEVAAERHALSPASDELGVRGFVNEPMRNFARADVRAGFGSAIARARVPAVPSDTTVEAAARMVAMAHAVFEAWRDVPAPERASVLLIASQAMRARRDELSGVMIREAGKTWREADADVCEAIDFCEFYARTAMPLFRRQRLGRFIGELDETVHEPRGVAVVISPWNFPLAICCGMTAAALVCGNTVVVKPAEQTTGIARIMVDVLRDAIRQQAARGGAIAGLAPEARDALVQLCPGRGETVGAALVRDPRVALIAFTGSRDVGLDILSAAAPPSPFVSRSAASGLEHVKKVVCEMGGKNAVIVDTSADLDEAVLGIRHSAFGFQGQKCSACSRVIVVDEQGPSGPAITGVRSRLVEAMRALAIGDPLLPGTDIGPVIDSDAAAKIEGFVQRAKASGLSWAALEVPAGGVSHGCAPTLRFVSPHIFWTVPTDHELAREEVFGPVMAIMHAPDFASALAIANGLPYRLTGGVFTRKPAHIERARREFRVGNLYINRGITGALVGRQPFGGGGMSGVGTKAGGTDYLLHFVEPRNICENTMRRGFAPEL